MSIVFNLPLFLIETHLLLLMLSDPNKMVVESIVLDKNSGRNDQGNSEINLRTIEIDQNDAVAIDDLQYLFEPNRTADAITLATDYNHTRHRHNHTRTARPKPSFEITNDSSRFFAHEQSFNLYNNILGYISLFHILALSLLVVYSRLDIIWQLLTCKITLCGLIRNAGNNGDDTNNNNNDDLNDNTPSGGGGDNSDDGAIGTGAATSGANRRTHSLGNTFNQFTKRNLRSLIKHGTHQRDSTKGPAIKTPPGGGGGGSLCKTNAANRAGGEVSGSNKTHKVTKIDQHNKHQENCLEPNGKVSKCQKPGTLKTLENEKDTITEDIRQKIGSVVLDGNTDTRAVVQEIIQNIDDKHMNEKQNGSNQLDTNPNSSDNLDILASVPMAKSSSTLNLKKFTIAQFFSNIINPRSNSFVMVPPRVHSNQSNQRSKSARRPRSRSRSNSRSHGRNSLSSLISARSARNLCQNQQRGGRSRNSRKQCSVPFTVDFTRGNSNEIMKTVPSTPQSSTPQTTSSFDAGLTNGNSSDSSSSSSGNTPMDQTHQSSNNDPNNNRQLLASWNPSARFDGGDSNGPNLLLSGF